MKLYQALKNERGSFVGFLASEGDSVSDVKASIKFRAESMSLKPFGLLMSSEDSHRGYK